jgi:twinkle protein
MISKVLGPAGIAAFERRGISVETAVRLGVYTARRGDDNQSIPDAKGNVVVFPFIERDVIVNEKFRGPGRRFWQRAGGKRTFYNSDVLDDPALEDGRLPLVITEGEIDCMTAIDAGFPTSVSVPDGAPPVTLEKPEEMQEIAPSADMAGKFEFLWNNRDRIKRVKRFILAVDSDPPGQRLAAELVRRLGTARCCYVQYMPGCKDLNEVLLKHGRETVNAVLTDAKPYPVRGLYRLSDYPELPELETFSVGWWTFDNMLRMFPGELMVITGIPSHGKSAWALNLLSNLARLHGWRSAVFSPEMPTVPMLRDKLRAIYGGDQILADPWIDDFFRFIDADPMRRGEEDFTLEWVLDRAEDAVLRDGIRVLLIDPWNEVEHARLPHEQVTDYIGRSLRALKRFARLYAVAVIVIAHPTKEIGRDGKTRTPSLYDIEGSAHWYNKCDHGIVVDRPDFAINRTTIRIAKVRFEATGQRGDVTLQYDRSQCSYSTLNGIENEETAI